MTLLSMSRAVSGGNILNVSPRQGQPEDEAGIWDGRAKRGHEHVALK